MLRLSRVYLRQLSLLALFFIVFGAFAPTVSKVLATTYSVVWVEICTADGSQHKVALNLSNTESEENVPVVMSNHCGYCLLLHHFPVLPPADLSWIIAAQRLQYIGPGVTGAILVRFFSKKAHRTRAPPDIS